MIVRHTESPRPRPCDRVVKKAESGSAADLPQYQDRDDQDGDERLIQRPDGRFPGPPQPANPVEPV
jgi:hypothetical protein